MGREYPRFLFSDPQHTKSKGSFIVHTLFPQLVAKVSIAEDGYFFIDPVAVFVEAEKHQVDEIVFHMHNWYQSMLMQKANLSDDFFIRASNIVAKINAPSYFETVTVTMVFKPQIGCRLDIKHQGWESFINFSNDDTYGSVLQKLKSSYHHKYGVRPDWPF